MTRTEQFLSEVEDILRNNILKFWIDKMQDPDGGFYGQMDGEGNIIPDAPKGAILNARILWSFSSAYRYYKGHNKEFAKECLLAATRAKDYLIEHFIDNKYGGVYWSLDADGKRLDTKKQFYALGFAIYGLSEYVRATGDDSALPHAINLYRCIERYSFDPQDNGYLEACTREWNEIADMRLSAKDANEKKTMNTHLHIIEPYTNLYRVWPDEELRGRISNLLDVFCDRIFVPETGHLGLFFDEKWNLKSEAFSYGHDIEAAWLLMEAAFVTGDIDIINKVRPVALRVGRAGWEGLQEDGSMIYENHPGVSCDTDRHWWVQAENVVGSLWLWKYMNVPEGADVAMKCWDYITGNLVDREGGEWFWSVSESGEVNTRDDHAGFWKCPYHNARMCIEVLEILK